MPTNFNNNIKAMSSAVVKYANTEYPGMAGKMALRFIDDNFRNQSWEGMPWKKRKGGKRNKGRALLIDKAVLRRGNRMQTGSGQVRIFNAVRYAKVHNEGFYGMVSIPAHHRRLHGKFKVSSIKTKKTRTKKLERGTTIVKAHARLMRIPRRQFAPTATRPSPTLNKQLNRRITLDMMKLLKQYK